MTTTPTWPTRRSVESGIVLQFGRARADLIGHALRTGDPLADAVVAAIHDGGRTVRVQLEQGLREGLASIDDPHPAVAALLTSTEAYPAYATDELIDRGSLPFFSMPRAVHMVSLSAGALIRVYQSPSIADVLTTTGRLIDGADRRIRETGKWVSTTMLPGSLRRGEAGYVGTIQVRMLHAHMRHLARTRGFDESAYGAPINQVDLARTWMDFTITSFTAEEIMGLGLTTGETADLFRYWWLVGHLLGIEPELIEGIQTIDQARRVDDMFQAVTGPLIPEASALAEATLNSISDLLHEALNVPRSLGAEGLHNLARRFHPTQVSDELGLRQNAVAGRVIDVAIGRIRAYRAGLRKNPARWAEEQQKQIDGTREFLGGDGEGALYQTHNREESAA
jgi:hypothetical protein